MQINSTFRRIDNDIAKNDDGGAAKSQLNEGFIFIQFFFIVFYFN